MYLSKATHFHQARNPKRTKNSHSHSVWGEPPSSSLVLKSAIVILSPNILKLGVVLERVNRALPFDSVSALHVVVVGQEQLLSSVELSPPSDRLLGPIVPPHPHLHVVPTIHLDLLYACYVWGLSRVRWSHQHTITSCQNQPKILKF